MIDRSKNGYRGGLLKSSKANVRTHGELSERNTNDREIHTIGVPFKMSYSAVNNNGGRSDHILHGGRAALRGK